MSNNQNLSNGIKQVRRQVRTIDANQVKADNDWVIEEQAIALVYNGISHAVMMATPCNLLDFAIGFSLSEGIIRQPADILEHEIIEAEHGIEIQLSISSRLFSELKHKRRSLMGNSGCGLCGVESLEQTIKTRATLPPTAVLPNEVIQQALSEFTQQQLLNNKTGSAHAAAYCSIQTGEIIAIREDVGRHNALDKLMGNLAQLKDELPEQEITPGFVLVSSRASYEMVDKTIAAGINHLVSISAATSKAIQWALQHQLNLIGFARSERLVEYTNMNASNSKHHKI
ncbi:formate dehydrogenase accessory sulfurtransferase FdhD [Thalassotalea fonticola]|uniref:Sulfur carrier protein FdhD n=1 Tax=Thalassotalea fonticola TaxID=3065649 RepID=A0ABZ0GM02_9GAMM|nr:formate dehydrogenase accessory sulfurtransferase FdhD [Colwelliaceae bacterium S1-1]